MGTRLGKVVSPNRLFNTGFQLLFRFSFYYELLVCYFCLSLIENNNKKLNLVLLMCLIFELIKMFLLINRMFLLEMRAIAILICIICTKFGIFLNSMLWMCLIFGWMLKVLAPLPIGFAVFMVHLATIPVTGTGINPARSLGAAVIYNQKKAWDDQVSIKLI